MAKRLELSRQELADKYLILEENEKAAVRQVSLCLAQFLLRCFGRFHAFSKDTCLIVCWFALSAPSAFVRYLLYDEL